MWPLERTQGFFLRFDLVFDPTFPIFKLVRDFIKTNILTNFHDNQTKNLASRAYTSQKVDATQPTTHDGHSTITTWICELLLLNN